MKIKLSTLKKLIKEEIETIANMGEESTSVDADMLKMLTSMADYPVEVGDVRLFQIRTNPKRISYSFLGGEGMDGSIMLQDLTNPQLKKIGLAGVAQWMLDHGATKQKSQQRAPKSWSSYD